MKDKIFISHSSDDIKVVESFVDNILKLGCEIPSNRIFCSSMVGHGVEGGQYIPSRIRKEIHNSELVILFISKSFKSSEVCLNELGAAWVTLDEENVIPVLLPDVDFNEIGFLKENHLGIKLKNDVSLKQLIHDKRKLLNPNYNPTILYQNIDKFCSDSLFENVDNSSQYEEDSIQYSKEQKEWIECFDKSLAPFHEVLAKSVPHLHNGIHHINETESRERIFTALSAVDWQWRLWYRMGDGDMQISNVKSHSNGIWIIDEESFGGEIKIEDMWVSINPESQNEFILIKTKLLSPFKIDSDIGGTSFSVGLLNDGTIISENEKLNGFAIINNKTINAHDFDVKTRNRDRESNWVFFGTDYHKVGGQDYEKVEQFCLELDTGEKIVSELELKKLIRSLKAHSTVIQYR